MFCRDHWRVHFSSLLYFNSLSALWVHLQNNELYQNFPKCLDAIKSCQEFYNEKQACTLKIYTQINLQSKKKSMLLFYTTICIQVNSSYSCHILSSNIWYFTIYIRLNSSPFELTKWPVPSWLGRAVHRYRWSHRFETRLSLDFFQTLISLLL